MTFTSTSRGDGSWEPSCPLPLYGIVRVACPECSRRFLRKAHYRRHWRRIHLPDELRRVRSATVAASRRRRTVETFYALRLRDGTWFQTNGPVGNVRHAFWYSAENRVAAHERANIVGATICTITLTFEERHVHVG